MNGNFLFKNLHKESTTIGYNLHLSNKILKSNQIKHNLQKKMHIFKQTRL